MKETILTSDQVEQPAEFEEKTLQAVHGGSALGKVAMSTSAGAGAGGFLGLVAGLAVTYPVMSKIKEKNSSQTGVALTSAAGAVIGAGAGAIYGIRKVK